MTESGTNETPEKSKDMLEQGIDQPSTDSCYVRWLIGIF